MADEVPVDTHDSGWKEMQRLSWSLEPRVVLRERGEGVEKAPNPNFLTFLVIGHLGQFQIFSIMLYDEHLCSYKCIHVLTQTC